MPLATLPRWSEEAQVFQQITSASENPAKIQRAILNLLSPPSEAQRVREQNAAQSSQSAPAPPTNAVTSTHGDDGILPMPVDVTGIAESLALVNASADEPIRQLLTSHHEDAVMHGKA
ncbi:hypothetical protein H4Q26_006596 [Puccinia striiformis f. sp. tritici PST-130]|nr:hypothetical protein H4Q26_006596 [Puccinia striiformis f. sp. tritici PST-130]